MRGRRPCVRQHRRRALHRVVPSLPTLAQTTILDVGNDDYYNHPRDPGSTYDDSAWLIAPRAPEPGVLHGHCHGDRRGGRSSSLPRTPEYARARALSGYDGGNRRCNSGPRVRPRLPTALWGGACSGASGRATRRSRAADRRHRDLRTGRRVPRRRVGPGEIALLDETPCGGECSVGSDPGCSRP